MARWVTALVFCLTLGLVAWRQQPPDVVPANAPGTEFSGARAFVQLERVLEDMGPHPVGTRANATVRSRIERRLDELGIAWQRQHDWVCNGSRCAPVDNLVASLPGETEHNVLLVAHYDSQNMGPGAADDGAGVACLLEAARLLSELELRNPVQLVFTDGEEMGLFGAQAVVADPLWSGDVAAVINLEARGTSGQASLFQTSADGGWLIEQFAQSAVHPFTSSLHATVYDALPSDTDLTLFLDAGLSGANFAFTDGLPRYHTQLDDLAHLDPRSVQHLGQQGVGLARQLATVDLDAVRAPGRLVYTDVLGTFVLRWPEPWTVPLALLGLLGVLALGDRRPRVLGGGIGLTLMGLGSAVLGGIAIEAAVVALEGAYTGVPEPFRYGCWLLALAMGAGPAGLGAKLGVKGMWTGVWATWALFGLALAVWLPGASVFFVVPTLSAVAVALIARLAGWDGWWAPLMGGLSGLVFWLALARAFEVGVDLIGVLVVVPVLLASQPLWPAWSAGGMSRAVPAGLALSSFVALSGTLFVEPASVLRPQHLQEVVVQRAQETVGVGFSSFQEDPMGRRDAPPPLDGVSRALEQPLASWWGAWERELEVAPHPGPTVLETPVDARSMQLTVTPVGEASALLLVLEPMPVVTVEGQVLGDPRHPRLWVFGDEPRTFTLTWPEPPGEVRAQVAQVVATPEVDPEWPAHRLPAHAGNRRVVYRTLLLTPRSPVLSDETAPESQ